MARLIKKRKIKKEKAALNKRGQELQSGLKPSTSNPSLSTPKVKSSKVGEAVQAPEGIAEYATSGPKLIKYYMSQGMTREQAVAKMARAKGSKLKKMQYGGAVKLIKKKKPRRN